METFEPQYNWQLEHRNKFGLTHLGLTSGSTYDTDPRRLLFLLARYKFVSKMLAGSESVLEVGCGDAFGLRLVQQTCKSLTGIDIDPIFIEDANSRMNSKWPFNCFVHDILSKPLPNKFSAAYSLDVLEHIPESEEMLYMNNIVDSLQDNGICMIGMPSLESQVYASGGSKSGHINCKTLDGLDDLLSKYFINTLKFSMNDEVVHTGFSPMAHYIFVIGLGVKGRNSHESLT
jgi:SAM-dependent methyltransferase